MKLSQAQLRQFEQEGYLIVEDALRSSDLDPVVSEYERYIDARANELAAQGKISSTFHNESFVRRLACICEQSTELYPELDIMEMRGKASFEFLRNDNLLDLVECFVGPEITCSPIQHIRPKLPTKLAADSTAESTHIAPWHQDAGVTWEEADPYFILTVWIPFVDAGPDNGCLQVFPRAHHDGLRRHATYTPTGTTIVAEEMPSQEPLTLPMRKGSVLFLHKQTPHRSTANHSNGVRWSADLRYQKTGTPTGRPFRPDFVVRSRSNSDSELTDHGTWCRLWEDALANEGGINLHRWAHVGQPDAQDAALSG